MAVVKRKRRDGTVYGVSNEWQSKTVWELVGKNRREAEIRDRQMKREIEAGTFVPRSGSRAVTVRQQAEAWVTKRTNPGAKGERDMLKLYLYPREWLCSMRLDDVKPTHIDRLIDELRSEVKTDGSRRLSDKTIYNFVATLRLIFKAAIRADLCVRQPVVLEKGTLDTSTQHEVEIYSKAEVVALTRHHSIPWPIRVLNALCCLAGLRRGEAIGLKWSEIDVDCEPLQAMTICRQYEGRRLKTKRPRVVPVHPELWAVLEEWGREGFELYTGAKPTPDDFVVPNCSKRATVRHHTKSSYYLQFVRTSQRAGVRPRSLHATRHTFVSLCRRGGARADVLERVTHNAAGKMIDRYTHFDWEPLCEAVLCLDLDVRREMHPGSKSPAGIGGRSPKALGGKTPENSAPGEFPGNYGRRASGSRLLGKNGPKSEPRRDARQDFEEFLEELRAANRERHRALLLLHAAKPADARPGLAFTRGLTEALKGKQADRKVMAKELATAGSLLKHLLPEEASSYVATGKRGAK